MQVSSPTVKFPNATLPTVKLPTSMLSTRQIVDILNFDKFTLQQFAVSATCKVDNLGVDNMTFS
jgi:hypothetical protein